MDRENHFLPKSKLLDLINSISQEKLEKDVTVSLQNFAEKFMSDIINKAMLFARHRGSDTVETVDVLFTAEKELDYSFGNRIIRLEKNLPSDEHIEKLAEISKNK